MEQAKQLLNRIRSLPGKKIVTLSLLLDDQESSDFIFDIDENGRVGYAKDHRNQFLTLLEHGIQNSGGLIIRQFTKLTYESENAEGQLIRLPYKLIYALLLGEGEYLPLSKEEAQEVCRVDTQTGKRVGREQGVIYRSFGWEEEAQAYHL